MEGGDEERSETQRFRIIYSEGGFVAPRLNHVSVAPVFDAWYLPWSDEIVSGNITLVKDSPRLAEIAIFNRFWNVLAVQRYRSIQRRTLSVHEQYEINVRENNAAVACCLLSFPRFMRFLPAFFISCRRMNNDIFIIVCGGFIHFEWMLNHEGIHL